MERENFKALIKAIDALLDTNEKLVTEYGLENDTMFSYLAEDIFKVLAKEFDDEDDILGDFIFTYDFGRLKDTPALYRNADAVYNLLCANMEEKEEEQRRRERLKMILRRHIRVRYAWKMKVDIFSWMNMNRM